MWYPFTVSLKFRNRKVRNCDLIERERNAVYTIGAIREVVMRNGTRSWNKFRTQKAQVGLNASCAAYESVDGLKEHETISLRSALYQMHAKSTRKSGAR